MKNMKDTEKASSQDVKMTEAGMVDLLIELSDTKFWPAILMYYNGLRITIETSLRSLDAFKEATEVARSQGRYQGITYLPSFIEDEKIRRAAKEKERAAKAKAK